MRTIAVIIVAVALTMATSCLGHESSTQQPDGGISCECVETFTLDIYGPDAPVMTCGNNRTIEVEDTSPYGERLTFCADPPSFEELRMAWSAPGRYVIVAKDSEGNPLDLGFDNGSGIVIIDTLDATAPAVVYVTLPD